MPFSSFDPQAELHVHRENLPHWRQRGTTYFVTARLADSLPQKVLEGWTNRRNAWLAGHGASSADAIGSLSEELRQEFNRKFTAEFHRLLDSGQGACVLANDACSKILARRFFEGHGSAYLLDAWCIMPNHFHALVEPLGKTNLGEIVRHWKGGSAFYINHLLGRKGQLWQQETFDHIVRNPMQLEHFRKYIEDNPKKARLTRGFIVGMAARQSSPGL